MIESHPSPDVARIPSQLGDGDEQLAKAGKKGRKKEGKEQESAGKSAEREQKILWDADKIQLKWIRLSILMVSIGFGADRTLHELGEGALPPGEIWVIRAVVQLLGVIGLVALGIATFQHGRFLSAVSRDEPIPVARFPLSLIVAIAVVILAGIIMVVAAVSLGSVSRVGASVPSDVAVTGTVVGIAATSTAAPSFLTPAAGFLLPAASPLASSVGVGPAPATATLVLPVSQAVTPISASGQSVTTATPGAAVVQNAGPGGARLRQAPVDGETITVLSDGTRLTMLDETSTAGGRLWQRVRTADDQEGWIAADLVVSINP